MALSSLEPHPQHDESLEQYATEGDLAAQWLLAMHEYGDLHEHHVVDVGAGNGILGLGAMLLGATSAVLIDADEAVCAVAETNATALGVGASVLHRHVTAAQDLSAEAGCTVVANPPWGVRTTGADRPVLNAIFGCTASVVHLMHHADAGHVEALAQGAGWASEEVLRATFRLPPVHAHQRSGRRSTEVVCRRFVRR